MVRPCRGVFMRNRRSLVPPLFVLGCLACADGSSKPQSTFVKDAQVDLRPDAAEPRGSGSACELHADCTSGYCVPPVIEGVATSWPDGICTAPCTDDTCGADQACVAFDDIGLCLSTCRPDQPDCRSSYVCHPDLQVCLPDCRVAWDCGTRFECSEETGACTLPSTPGRPMGAACVDAFDCLSMLCLTPEDEAGEPTGWTDGLCTQPCLDGDCGLEGVCTRLGEHLFCVPACDGLASCRAGYVCNDTLHGCLPDCRAGWTCAEGFECADSGQCTLRLPPVSRLSEACAAHYECETEICLAAAAGWPGGSCAAVCGSAACGTTSGCVDLSGVNYCLATCTSTTACRPGYVCSPEPQVCLPDCRDGFACGSAATCSAETGVCESFVPTGLALGAPCTAHSQCESQQCLLWPATGFDLGVCTTSCSATCAGDLLCVTLDSAPVCLPACASGCAQNFVCSGDACVPSCLWGWPCPAGETCRSNGLCRKTNPGPGPGPGGR